MKKSILFLLMTTVLLLGQSTADLKKAAKKAGITTEAQARELAKQRGMTDAQIDAEIKERGLTPGGEESAIETPQVEPVEAPPAEAVVETATPEDEAAGEERATLLWLRCLRGRSSTVSSFNVRGNRPPLQYRSR